MTAIDDMLATHAITQTLYRYCRALDRMDVDLFDTVFTVDARLDYGPYFCGSPAEFRSWVWKAHEGMLVHSHQIANVLTEVNGDAAVSEAYITVCLRTSPAVYGRALDLVERGRYLDRWLRRDDNEWRIVERRYVCDVQQSFDASEFGEVTAVRDSSDPSHEFFH